MFPWGVMGADRVRATQMNGNLVRVTNDQDPVTQVPSKVFGYRHPAGEVHIRPGNVTLACAGQEDEVRSRFPPHPRAGTYAVRL